MTIRTTAVKKSETSLDPQALEEAYERYSSDIYRYAYRLLNDNELAEDCVADTFHRLLMAMRGGIKFENIRAYLYRIAHNCVTDHYRRHPMPAVPLEDDAHSDPSGNPSILVGQKLERQLVRAALLHLPAEQRQVIELRFMENWSHQEVADALGKSVEATRALQYRAVESLRQLLAE